MVLVNEVICYISIYTFKICGGSVFIYHTWDFHCILSIRKLKSHYGKSSTNMALEPDTPINLCSKPPPQPWTHCHLFCKMRISTCGAVNKTYNVYKSTNINIYSHMYSVKIIIPQVKMLYMGNYWGVSNTFKFASNHRGFLCFVSQSVSRVRLYDPKDCSQRTPRTVANQTSQSMEFSRQEYWSGQSFFPPGDLPNPGPLHCRQILHHLNHLGSPLVF